MPDNNSNFDWSDDAINVISMFYNVDKMVYVEGKDDILFWEIIFKKNLFNVKIQETGSCSALVPYMEKITSGKINAVVALDADLNFFSSNIINHTNIIYTKSYSIENTMLDEKMISKILKNYGKYQESEINDIDVKSWLDDFYSKMENLVILDIYNHINQRGISVISDSCERFIESKRSHSVCIDKINSFIQELPDDFKKQGLSIKQSLKFPKNTGINNWLKGHFLFSASLKFITNYLSTDGKKTSISKDSFYSNILSLFELFFTEEHDDYSYYKQKISLVSKK